MIETGIEVYFGDSVTCLCGSCGTHIKSGIIYLIIRNGARYCLSCGETKVRVEIRSLLDIIEKMRNKEKSSKKSKYEIMTKTK